MTLLQAPVALVTIGIIHASPRDTAAVVCGPVRAPTESFQLAATAGNRADLTQNERFRADNSRPSTHNRGWSHWDIMFLLVHRDPSTACRSSEVIGRLAAPLLHTKHSNSQVSKNRQSASAQPAQVCNVQSLLTACRASRTAWHWCWGYLGCTQHTQQAYQKAFCGYGI